jgi:hypothetical protein
MHESYNYLQSIFNQKLFTKDIKNAKAATLQFVDLKFTTLKGGGAQRSQSELIKIRECFVSANECNRSKLSHDNDQI